MAREARRIAFWSASSWPEEVMLRISFSSSQEAYSYSTGGSLQPAQLCSLAIQAVVRPHSIGPAITRISLRRIDPLVPLIHVRLAGDRMHVLHQHAGKVRVDARG